MKTINEELILMEVNRQLIRCMESISSLTSDKAERVYEMLDEINNFINGFDAWTSVEDELPKEYGEVLCYTKSGRVIQLVYNPKYELFNVSCDNIKDAISVTHWQPLPHEPINK